MARFLLSIRRLLAGLKDPVPTQGFQEFADIRSDDIDIGAVRGADLIGYLALVTSRADQFEDLRSDGIEGEHLALPDV
jgi:hypothetical protein